MSWETFCVCDACGAQKGEANHWLLAWLFTVDGVEFFGVTRWEERAARSDGMIHLCGNACLQRRLGEHLARPAERRVAAIGGIESGDAGQPPDRIYLRFEPPSCAYCGPVCHGGAAHNARVEDDAKYGGAE